ncbi:MAG: PaaI family thioesterase [Anaerolineales bacterium]|jgi:acyl-coenzyme A thioesterase PaaI-like protein
MTASDSIMDHFRQRYGDRIDEFLVPPPSFLLMEGEFVAFDPAAGILVARFPVDERYLNPYGAMQGGLAAAAVDNTLGPLSMLVAPPNVTRRLEMKYSRAIKVEMGSIEVRAEVVGREDRWLDLKADVRTLEGDLLARAKARHWIVEVS